MSPLERTLALKDVEIAPDCGNRRIYQLGKLVQRRKLHLGKVFLNSLLAFFGLHYLSRV
jgi:hypothetical protein